MATQNSNGWGEAAKPMNHGFGTFGFDTPSDSNTNPSFGWDNQSTNQEQDNSNFGFWTPNMFDESSPSSSNDEKEKEKDKIIKDLEKDNSKYRRKVIDQIYHIEHLNKMIDNLNIDIGIKNQTIENLQKEVRKLKSEEQSTAFVTNQSSIRKAVDLLNSMQNYQVSSNYTKVVVFSARAKQYFTCLKLWDGKWTEGNLYKNSVHNLNSIELY